MILNRQIGKLFLVVGSIIIIIGLILLFKQRIPFLKNLGNLPGDIYIKKDSFQFYFPITTCIVLSIIFSLIIGIFFKR